jgi:hypothetical protein
MNESAGLVVPEFLYYAVILTTNGRKNLSDVSKSTSLRFFTALRMTVPYSIFAFCC